MTVLHTSRLTLTPCTPSDSDDFIALERDGEVMRFLNGGPVDHATIGADPGFLMPRGTEPYVWTARRTMNNAFVGWFCLWPESDTLAELGYRLRRADWGQGLASEGALVLVDYGFSSCRYDTITATTMSVNHGSRRVMEKLGMRHVSTEYPHWPVLIPGSEEGEVWYEVKREDWEAAER
ncbi:GNAT family N-acetyltransferase [Ciceribacter sp. L1K23]|uniref:GNAT family N-acetyltransferase n=1 Tax=Ciceribacter sp. L1K23 TaxID=2820276 RepID=UPI001B83DCAF|nr:GNAT family N-acetyltransferase [Ciceribacter sp. L1K23]MBR0557812.1 GNAT family N-acetyltransferase [Ciceribacter sp. L1K23]